MGPTALDLLRVELPGVLKYAILVVTTYLGSNLLVHAYQRVAHATLVRELWEGADTTSVDPVAPILRGSSAHGQGLDTGSPPESLGVERATGAPRWPRTGAGPPWPDQPRDAASRSSELR